MRSTNNINEEADTFGLSASHVLSSVHLLEKVVAIASFVVTAIEIVRGNSGAMQFVLLWSVLACLSIFAALWPHAPRVWSRRRRCS